MESFFTSLAVVHPLLSQLARALSIVAVALLLWLVISIPAAICFAALKAALYRLAASLLEAAGLLYSKFQGFWAAALALRAAAIAKLTLRYVYDVNERKLLSNLQRVGGEAISVGQLIEKTHSSLDTTLAPLKREIRLIVEGSQGATGTIAMPDMQELQASSLMRRTSIVMLCVMFPLAAALITVNTALLTKFFESFFEQYISYDLGIKWATMVALMFSFLEMALGVLMYYIGKAGSKDPGMVTALLKALIVVLVVALASIESYLYLLLSIDIASQTGNINLPAAIESFRHWWLSPFGFVIVTGLSLIGHFVVDGLNRFSEAGHLQDLKEALTEAKRSISKMDSVWDSIRTRIESAKLAFTSFESILVGDKPSPLSALTTLREMNTRISLTVQALVNARREPVSSISPAEAEGVFDTHLLLLGTLVVALIAFCWLQMHFLRLVPAFQTTDPSIFLAVGLLQAAALLIAGYKAYPNTTTHVEGIGTESLHSPREWLVTVACFGVIGASLVSNLFLTKDDPVLQWGVFFAVAVIAIATLVILGKTLPLLIFVTSTLVKQLAATIASAVALLLFLLTWLLVALVKGLCYLLFLLAYPFLFIFWKSLLESM